MTKVATTDEILEWARRLKAWGERFEETVPSVKSINGRVKVPQQAFYRLEEEATRLLLAIRNNAEKTRMRAPLLKHKARRKPKDGGA